LLIPSSTMLANTTKTRQRSNLVKAHSGGPTCKKAGCTLSTAKNFDYCSQAHLLEDLQGSAESKSGLPLDPPEDVDPTATPDMPATSKNPPKSSNRTYTRPEDSDKSADAMSLSNSRRLVDSKGSRRGEEKPCAHCKSRPRKLPNKYCSRTCADDAERSDSDEASDRGRVSIDKGRGSNDRSKGNDNKGRVGGGSSEVSSGSGGITLFGILSTIGGVVQEVLSQKHGQLTCRIKGCPAFSNDSGYCNAHVDEALHRGLLKACNHCRTRPRIGSYPFCSDKCARLAAKRKR
jgi:hypothetical protein